MNINFSSSWDVETLQNKTYDEETSITMMCPKCFNVHRIPFDEISEKHGTKIKKINKYRKKGYIKPFYYNDDIVDFVEPEIITRGKCEYCKEMTEFIIMDEKIADVVSIFNNKGYFTSFSCEGHIIKKNHGSIPYIAFKTEDIIKYKDYIPFGWVIERKSLDFSNPVIIRGRFEPFDNTNYGNQEHQIILDDLLDFANSLPDIFHNKNVIKKFITTFDKFILLLDEKINEINDKNYNEILHILYFYIGSELNRLFNELFIYGCDTSVFDSDIYNIRKYIVYRLKQVYTHNKIKRREIKEVQVFFIKSYRLVEKCFNPLYVSGTNKCLPAFMATRFIQDFMREGYGYIM